MTNNGCAYCGNTSGFRNKYGNCISCGAPLILSQVETSANPIPTHFNVHSGSSYYLQAVAYGIYSPNEVRDLLASGQLVSGQLL